MSDKTNFPLALIVSSEILNDFLNRIFRKWKKYVLNIFVFMQSKIWPIWCVTISEQKWNNNKKNFNTEATSYTVYGG